MRKETSKSKTNKRIARKKGDGFLRTMLSTISGTQLWRDDYERVFGRYSYAVDDKPITFDGAVEACQHLVKRALSAGANS